MTTFADMLHPMSTEAFFKTHFEKQFLHVKQDRDLTGLFSWNELLTTLKNHSLAFEQDINACSYDGEVKHSLNPCCGGGGCQATPAAADADVVAKLFQDKGATVQFHQPQRYSKPLQELVYNLEQEFGCLVGTNLYVTPADCQGLAPHHDDIEAFVLQLEGSKKWRLYKPLEVSSLSTTRW